jgi:predicted nucleic acid-binding Zn ribbon protein
MCDKCVECFTRIPEDEYMCKECGEALDAACRADYLWELHMDRLTDESLGK